MSKKQLKSPQVSEQAEQPTKVVQKTFGGMLKGGVPLSIIDKSQVYRHINIIGYGMWAEGRPGTRRYSIARLPEEIFTAQPLTDNLNLANRFEDGDRVRCRTNGVLPAPLIENEIYYAIYIDATNIQLASTLANALAGTQIDITDAGTGTHFIRYAGQIHSSGEHKKIKRIVKHYGRKVYVSERDLESYNEVINLESADPSDDDSRMVESGDAMILAAGVIFRVVLNASFYYMYRINTPLPTVMITDIAETGILKYVYCYVYSQAIITGTGIRNRLTDNCKLEHETGTTKDPDAEKYYGEVAFANPVGVNLAQDHIIELLTLPINNQSITHFPLYRTKVINNAGGGLANNRAYFIWDEDVPVCKAVSVTIAANTATIVAGQVGFVIGDVGCALLVDAAGTRSGIISQFISSNQVDLQPGHTLLAAESVAIGEGRVMTASQTGFLITRTLGDDFLIGDEGRRVFWGDGGEVVVRRFIDAANVEAAESATHAPQACTIQRGDRGLFAFRRKWNDTIRDDCIGTGDIGLNERLLAGRDLYIPQINFNPVPDSNIVVSDSGFSLFAMRDANDYWYSNIGAKPYIEGQYRADHQFGKIVMSIKDVRLMPGLAIFLCSSKTFVLSLNIPIPNVGNESVGEFIQKLTEPNEADGHIGVVHWKTIAFTNASLFIALTNEPAIRKFNGHQWSPENFANSTQNNLPAVMSDLNKIDSHYGLIGWYSGLGGYKLFVYKWKDV